MIDELQRAWMHYKLWQPLKYADDYRVSTEARGRSVDEWKLRAGAPDNHWLVGVVGCAVAVSIQGVSLLGMGKPVPMVRNRISLSELQRRKRNG